MSNPRRIAFHRWLDAERDSLYWAELSNICDKYDGRITLFSGLLSSGAVLSLIIGTVADFGLPQYEKGLITGGCAVLSATLTFIGRHKSFGKKSAKYAMLHDMNHRQARCWKRLLDELTSGNQPSKDLMFELQLQSEAFLVHEAGHVQNNKIALKAERMARNMADSYNKKIKD